MAKTTIRSLVVGSIIAFAGALAYANGDLVKRGPDVTGLRETLFGWAMGGLAVVVVLVIVAIAVIEFTAWVGAVLNAARLHDKIWFVILLVAGLLSFGFIAMIIYLIAVA
jgi:hypothetical protein